MLQGTTGNYTGTLATNKLPLYVGTDWNLIARAFDGYIDEVRVVADALTQAEMQALRTETQPCANSARFTITHNAFGINCVAETITVNVVDAVAGTPLLNYNAAVQLDTQSGYGTWALVTGSGTFSDGTADDGIATYTWPLGQSQATFTLYYPQGSQSIDVDVFQISNTAIRDNDAEGALVFSPNGFTVTAAALANPPGTVAQFATNQTAGTNFALYLAAYGQTPTDPVCGIIEAYTGAKNVKFWSQYVDPEHRHAQRHDRRHRGRCDGGRVRRAGRHVHERPGVRDGEVQGRRAHPHRHEGRHVGAGGGAAVRHHGRHGQLRRAALRFRAERHRERRRAPSLIRRQRMRRARCSWLRARRFA